MRAKDLAMLFLLAAMWGGSYLFIRIAVPVTGPVVLAFLRVVFAAAGLVAYAWGTRRDTPMLARWRTFLLLGALNALVPYILIATAELHLTAALAAILNATTPLFAALLGVVWLGERLTLRTGCGLLLGFGGVAVLVGWSPLPLNQALLVGVVASLLAALSYAVAGILAKKLSAGLSVLSLALGQQIGASVLLLPLAVPLAISTPSTLQLTPLIAAVILALALLSTSLGYLLYFTLIANIGPTRTLGVTFLVPAFGMLWGSLFLHEPIQAGILLGLALILASILLTSGIPLWSPGKATVCAETIAEKQERPRSELT